jgi:hypothetical protein
MWQSRSHVLEIYCKEGVEHWDAWSWGRFDDEDQLFFVSGDTAWDTSLLRLQVHLPEHGWSARCTFIGVNWSDLTGRVFPHTILDDGLYTEQVAEIQSQLERQHATSEQIMPHLISNIVPKTSSIAMPIEGKNLTALVTCNVQKSSSKDREMCLSGKFWKVTFTVEECEKKDPRFPVKQGTQWPSTNAKGIPIRT